ncbi:unnamed protein product [Coffea canephora]|uniref:DH200=94 genomic scaffold, scaffold_9009 n=1 Tax=Coffea canephora TaxID=49390 RepID=A0A068VMK2_COFCA|nr:unnamed protein product [Coffea canephora]
MGNFLLVMLRSSRLTKWDARIYQCIVLPSLPCELQSKSSNPLHLVLWSLSGSFCCGSFDQPFNLKKPMK